MTNTPLSHRLRAETKEAHTTAERSGIMRDLLRGTIALPAYVLLLQNLAALYEAMEAELDRNSNHPALQGIEWHALRRFPALQHDIAQLPGPAVSSAATDALVPATHEYVTRIHQLGNHTPALLFAHAYLRYLGDMYGGQIIKRIVLEKVIPGSEHAVSFYDFEHLGNLHAFMVPFRESLDAISLSAAEADSMVAEAQLGYELHARMFEELAARA
ncbi:MAG: biliverdin-producing heme oxygenase [Gemmatimonadaceae bacterium]